jgi:hypothetical protein
LVQNARIGGARHAAPNRSSMLSMVVKMALLYARYTLSSVR